MGNIKVQPHANRISRHQIIDVTVLIHLDLRVARARAQRAHHNRRSALLTAQQLGNRIDIFNGKPNDCGPRRHPRQLFGPRISQRRHAFAPHKLGLWNHLRDRGLHRFCAQKQRLM